MHHPQQLSPITPFSTAQETAGQTLTRLSAPQRPLKLTTPPPAPRLGPPCSFQSAPLFKWPTSPSQQLDLMPTQVYGLSLGAMCETQEFTTIKSFGKYGRSVHTRSRVSSFRQDPQILLPALFLSFLTTCTYLLLLVLEPDNGWLTRN